MVAKTLAGEIASIDARWVSTTFAVRSYTTTESALAQQVADHYTEAGNIVKGPESSTNVIIVVVIKK